jgi:hypothetical protein
MLHRELRALIAASLLSKDLADLDDIDYYICEIGFRNAFNNYLLFVF